MYRAYILTANRLWKSCLNNEKCPENCHLQVSNEITIIIYNNYNIEYDLSKLPWNETKVLQCDNFLISARHMPCGYSLEPPK